MKAKIKAIYNIILPNNRINRFVLLLFIIGFISGAFFLTIINEDQKSLVITKITNFITNINNNSINKIDLLKNNAVNNLIYILSLWILGISIIGVILNIFILYLKGFILGFTVSSIILTYKTKGILFSLIYVFPNELIKILMIILIGVYSLTLSINIITEILKKKNTDIRKLFKKYLAVLLISILIISISTLYETFIIPILLNIIY